MQTNGRVNCRCSRGSRTSVNSSPLANSRDLLRHDNAQRARGTHRGENLFNRGRVPLSLITSIFGSRQNLSSPSAAESATSGPDSRAVLPRSIPLRGIAWKRPPNASSMPLNRGTCRLSSRVAACPGSSPGSVLHMAPDHFPLVIATSASLSANITWARGTARCWTWGRRTSRAMTGNWYGRQRQLSSVQASLINQES